MKRNSLKQARIPVVCLCLVLLFGAILFFGMDATSNLPAGDGQSGEGKDAEAVKACLQSALEDEIPIRQNGDTLGDAVDLSSASFALVDMDGDGTPEAVVQDLDDVVVIHCAGERAYGAYFSFRTMYYIQKDGRYAWNDVTAEGHRYGESRLRFSGGECTSEVLWMIQNDGEPDAVYYLRGKEVTQEQLKQSLDLQTSSPVPFLPLNAANMRAAFE